MINSKRELTIQLMIRKKIIKHFNKYLLILILNLIY